MPNPIGSILRAASRRRDEPLRCLSFPTHERYQGTMSAVNAVFYLVQAEGVKGWTTHYGPLPANHILLDGKLGDLQIPAELDFDVVLSQNKWGQFPIAQRLARQLQLPLVTLEHTLPDPRWPQAQIDGLRQLRGDVNVFISEYSRDKWGWSADDAVVIHHGVDTDLFCPNQNLAKKKDHVLSVVNDWVNRDLWCGFRLWQETIQGLPHFVLGDTPGLSAPAKSVPDLVRHYREARVFLNTSLVSPIPTVLLEAAACGCAIVSTANCAIPEVIKHGVNGLLGNTPAELAAHCRTLLGNPELCRELGAAARRTVAKRLSLYQFTKNWDTVLQRAAQQTFTGE